eukprot:CAMPEP_0176492118 /NCGR_PEP_ID=MMETSP0200_2-20121128/8805_1 /TAXON_ID=947934 /ORGANISM="Chaetoceros sp., Strain GSL56" /LENGTH=204 /DNA_ID=CAMNT_0017889613 /DNA_START=5 /DNA_END=619 /DNA_ORIENTATION=+
MGMRFMQRKNASIQQQQQQQQKQQPTKTTQAFSHDHGEANKGHNNSHHVNVDTDINDTFLNPNLPMQSQSQVQSQTGQQLQRQQIGDDNDEKEINHNSQPMIQNIPIVVASAYDMYGISANIIGRRSFNNFHKTVEDTWLNAVKTLSQHKLHGDAGDSYDVEKQQMTDEELLKRYEKYVKGRGNMMVDKKEKSIGNLNKKKRKR